MHVTIGVKAPAVRSGAGLAAGLAAGFAAGTCTAAAAATVAGLAIVVDGGDPGAVVLRGVPSWLWPLVAASVTGMVGGVWAVRSRRPAASRALAMASTAALAPALALVSRLPAPIASAALAAAPLAVGGLAAAGLRWRPTATTGVVARLVWVLTGLASVIHLLGYNSLADPGCIRTCVALRPLLGSVLTTRSTVILVAALTAFASGLAVATILGHALPFLPWYVAATTLGALLTIPAPWVVRSLSWADVTPSPLLLFPELLAVGAVGAALCGAGLATVRRHAELERLIVRLSAPRDTLRNIHRTITGIQFVVPGEDRWVDLSGRAVGETVGETAGGRSVVLSDRSGPAVRLLLAGRADPGEVLAGLSPAARLALRNTHLAVLSELRLAQVRASQRRIVAASDAERRRIERDLHDGAQQRLVSVAFHLKVALAHTDPATAARLVAADHDVHEALARLRRLAHGIFPSALAEEGLTVALRELAATSEIPTTVEAADVGRLGEQAEMAAYAAATEALNAARRSGPNRAAHIRLTQQDGKLTVQVTITPGDTAETSPMDAADRVGALGGRLDVLDTADATVFTAVIPCES
jgi:signal transduction histidine kinase